MTKKKKNIVTFVIETFMDQSSVIHPNAFNLRKIADTSDEIIRGLKSIDSKQMVEMFGLFIFYYKSLTLKIKSRGQNLHKK